MNKSLRLFLGLSVSAGCFWFLFRKFDFQIILQSLRSADFIWLPPSFLIFILIYLLRAARWRVLLTALKPVPYLTVLPTLILGFFSNNVLPARGGEVVRGMLMSRKSNIPVSSVLGTIVAERITDLTGLMMVILIASRLLPWEKLPLLPIGATIVGGLIVSTAFIFYARHHRNNTAALPGLRGKVVLIFTQLTQGFLALQSIKKVLSVLSLSWIIWSCELMLAFCVARLLHLDLSIFETAALIVGLSLGVIIPAAPGYVGTYELFGKTVLVMLGKPADASLSYVVLLHFFQIGTMALAALAAYLFLERRPSEAVS